LSVTRDRSVVFSTSSGSSTNKTDRHDITDILLKVALNTIKQTNKHKYTCSVRLYLQLFVGGYMSYLRYLAVCLHCVYLCPTHIVLCFCFVFVLLFLWIVPHFWLPLRYSLTFIHFIDLILMTGPFQFIYLIKIL